MISLSEKTPVRDGKHHSLAFAYAECGKWGAYALFPLGSRVTGPVLHTLRRACAVLPHLFRFSGAIGPRATASGACVCASARGWETKAEGSSCRHSH